MKQKIIISQFQELTLEQQNKLRDLWQSKQYNQAAYTSNCLSLLSIGQCLDMLERYAPMLGMKHGCYGSWHLEIWTEKAHIMFEDKECIDVLWRGVKYILEIT